MMRCKGHVLAGLTAPGFSMLLKRCHCLLDCRWPPPWSPSLASKLLPALTPLCCISFLQMASTLIAVFGFNGYEAPRDSVNPCQVRTPCTSGCRMAGSQTQLLPSC